MYYDRSVSDKLIGLLADGALKELRTWVKTHPKADIQLRADPKTGRNVVTIYVGLTKILDIHALGRDVDGPTKLRFSGVSRSELPEFGAIGQAVRPINELDDTWPRLADFLNAAYVRVKATHTEKEGNVQTILCRDQQFGFSVVDAQAVIGYESQIERDAVFKSTRDAYQKSVRHWMGESAWFNPDFGGELDLLAADEEGHVLVVEIKHRSDSGKIAASPAQVGFYATLFRRWASASGPEGSDTIKKMVNQRVRLGVSLPLRKDLIDPLEFIPVIAIGGYGPEDDPFKKFPTTRFAQVRFALKQAGLHEPKLELWFVTADGVITKKDPPAPDPSGTTPPVIPKQREWQTGNDILTDHLNGKARFGWVGRQGGLEGRPFTADVRHGTWKTWKYRVSDKDEGSNWFSVEDFAAAVNPPIPRDRR